MPITDSIAPGGPDRLVDQTVFRDVAGHFTTGVTVITTADDGVPAGTTASAVASLSVDPPMMLVCLNRSSATHDHVVESGIFGVNIMAQNQGSTALAFARKGPDKFAGIPWSPAANGVPLIDGSLATIACRVVDTAVGGTHTVFMGEVLEAAAFPGAPLTYYRGSFGRFEQDAEEDAYKALRQHVLHRAIPVGTPVDPQAVAEQIKSRPEHVHKALVRLESEGLIERAADGSALVAPVTSTLARGFFAAQAAIEAGVVDTYLPHASQDQLNDLREVGAALRSAAQGDTEDLSAYLDTVKQFHRSLIGLSPSAQLLGAYEELSTAALWFHILPAGQQVRMLDHENLLGLADAVLARDPATATAAIRRHLDVVVSIAETAIAAHGGTV